jgi:hypothetical protein
MVCDSRSTCVLAQSSGSTCKADSECSGGFCDLRSGMCIPTWSCGGKSGDCGAGWTCDSRKICVPTPCTASSQCMESCYCDRGNCIETASCQKDSDCTKLNMTCDTQRHTCTPSTPPPTTGCQKDGQCPGGQTCCDGACKDPRTKLPELTCAADDECGGGICRKDASGDGLCHRACQGNTDCGTGDTCSMGNCWKNPTPVVACVFNRQCGDGQTCINATCHLDCTADKDCPNKADFCDQGICQPDWRRVSACVIDSNCSYALDQCVNGTCATRCMQDADCSGCPHGPVCKLGYCAAQ